MPDRSILVVTKNLKELNEARLVYAGIEMRVIASNIKLYLFAVAILWLLAGGFTAAIASYCQNIEPYQQASCERSVGSRLSVRDNSALVYYMAASIYKQRINPSLTRYLSPTNELYFPFDQYNISGLSGFPKELPSHCTLNQ